MMNKIKIIVLGSVVMLSGCGPASDWIKDAPVHDIDFNADVRWADVPQDSISRPEMLVSFGPYILWADNSLDRPVWIWNEDTGELSSPVMSGRASNEILDVQEIMQTPDGFALMDTFKKRLYYYRLDPNSAEWRQENSEDTKEFCWVTVAEDTIVGQLMDGTARYGVKPAGEGLRRFGDYSEYGLANGAGWGLLMGHGTANASQGLYAVYSCYTSAYSIVDYRDTATVCSRSLEMSSFNNHGDHYVSMRPDSKMGFVSVASNDNYIFALYDGKELDYYMSHPGVGLRGNDICIFSWDGSYVNRLHSDRPVSCIAWNGERQSLYLCVLDNDEFRFAELAADTIPPMF